VIQSQPITPFLLQMEKQESQEESHDTKASTPRGPPLAKKRKSKQKIFGVPLLKIVSRQQHLPHALGLSIPYIVHHCIQWLAAHSLRVQGIFRTSGSLDQITSLVKKFDTSAGDC
jgi:hypothetical protein